MPASSSRTLPAPPRIAPPDLPHTLDDADGVARGIDAIGARLVGLTDDESAAHGRLAESLLAPASLTRLDLTGATLTDVRVDDLRAVELIARDGVWRNVEITGGRIGTLDGLRAEWSGVVLRGVRIEYLSLPSASLGDVLIVECEIRTLDVPDARLSRVRFEGSRADEVDTRGLRAADLDLRGLDALSFTEPRGLSGAWLDARQSELHAPSFAAALGIRIA